MRTVLRLLMVLRGITTLGLWFSVILFLLSLIGVLEGIWLFGIATVVVLVLRTIVTLVANQFFMQVHADDPDMPTGKLYCNYPMKSMFENAIVSDPDSVKLFYAAPSRRPKDYTARQAAEQGIAHGFVFNMDETWSGQLFVDDDGSVRIR